MAGIAQSMQWLGHGLDDRRSIPSRDRDFYCWSSGAHNPLPCPPLGGYKFMELYLHSPYAFVSWRLIMRRKTASVHLWPVTDRGKCMVHTVATHCENAHNNRPCEAQWLLYLPPTLTLKTSSSLPTECSCGFILRITSNHFPKHPASTCWSSNLDCLLWCRDSFFM